jgi:hypothetical protein
MLSAVGRIAMDREEADHLAPQFRPSSHLVFAAEFEVIAGSWSDRLAEKPWLAAGFFEAEVFIG